MPHARRDSLARTATPPRAVQWCGGEGGYLRLIDQTRLPNRLAYVRCRDVETVCEAIKSLRVRGAPAIGIAAAYGTCLGLRGEIHGSRKAFLARLDQVTRALAQSRPTAVNLFWSLERMRRRALDLRGRKGAREIFVELLREAAAIEEEDRQACRAIGRFGEKLLADGQGVLTHCNAGSLATAEYGTALAVIYAAHDSGKTLHVYADETRPLLQGARLTAWELLRHGVEVTLICDSMAAQVMKEAKVQAVVTGADRIAANGDTANKIGTYGLALLASAHGIPLYVAAPTSTFDLALHSGDAIPIEQRSPDEITHIHGRLTAPSGVRVYNPAFDVTPARLIRAIICERGVIEPVTAEQIAAVVGVPARPANVRNP